MYPLGQLYGTASLSRAHFMSIARMVFIPFIANNMGGWFLVRKTPPNLKTSLLGTESIHSVRCISFSFSLRRLQPCMLRADPSGDFP